MSSGTREVNFIATYVRMYQSESKRDMRWKPTAVPSHVFESNESSVYNVVMILHTEILLQVNNFNRLELNTSKSKRYDVGNGNLQVNYNDKTFQSFQWYIYNHVSIVFSTAKALKWLQSKSYSYPSDRCDSKFDFVPFSFMKVWIRCTGNIIKCPYHHFYDIVRFPQSLFLLILVECRVF